jgi:hypothetical protein
VYSFGTAYLFTVYPVQNCQKIVILHRFEANFSI